MVSEFPFREAVEQFVESDPRFHAGEGRAETEMRPEPERQMSNIPAMDIETIRIGESPWIPIGRTRNGRSIASMTATANR